MIQRDTERAECRMQKRTLCIFYLDYRVAVIDFFLTFVELIWIQTSKIDKRLQFNDKKRKLATGPEPTSQTTASRAPHPWSKNDNCNYNNCFHFAPSEQAVLWEMRFVFFCGKEYSLIHHKNWTNHIRAHTSESWQCVFLTSSSV